MSNPFRVLRLRTSLTAACLIIVSYATANADSSQAQRVPSYVTTETTALPGGEQSEQATIRSNNLAEPTDATTSENATPRRGFRVRRVNNSGSFHMPGEFERQRALLISCQAIQSSVAVREVVRTIAPRVTVVALHTNDQEYQAACEALADSGIRPDYVHFMSLPHDTMWTRDYGPVTLRSKRSRNFAVLDTQYGGDRQDDDVVPLMVAELARVPVVSAALNIEGGNMISNGKGLVITTTKLLEKNPEHDKKTMTNALRTYYGARQVVFLESLADEPTEHVDMFATFTSPNCVVVGAYDPGDDRVNADILNRNAKRLSTVRVGRARLIVRRIPMPSNADGIWRTYANVVYGNGMLLMPTYSKTNAQLQRKAVATYRSLLPGWKLALINADDLIEAGGALHCVVLNLGPLSADRIGLRPSRYLPRNRDPQVPSKARVRLARRRV